MSSGYDFDLICIGSGPAGQRAAIQAAKLGRRVGLVEYRRSLGGVCVDTGTIPSKTLREAVLFYSSLGGLFDRRRGRRPDHRPTAADLLARVSEVMRREAEVVEDQLVRNGVRLLYGFGTLQDAHTVAVQSDDGCQSYTTDKILIAVGTRPAPPPGVPEDSELVITSDGMVNLARLPRSLIVVGGGVIGIEYASMISCLNVEVTLVERRERPLGFIDREIVDELIHQMRSRDVMFRFGEAVSRLEVGSSPTPRAIVHLESGKRLTGDLVLFSIGRIAATDRLGLDRVGLTADERGRLSVDEHLRTAVPHIYAAGDVIGRPALAATSAEQGRRAACHAFGMPSGERARDYPIGIYAVPEISTVGATEQELTADRVPYEVGIARYREIARGHILGDDSGLLKLLFHRQTHRLLGVHVIGTGATELVHIGQAVLVLGGGLDYLLETVFNYPTLAECYKVAALDAYNKLVL